MHVTERAERWPAHCVVTGSGEGPFLDTDATERSIDPGILIRVQVVRDMGRFVGMVDPDVHQALAEELAAATQRIDQLEAELAEADRSLQAVEVLKNHGFDQARRAGRPRKVEA